MPMDERYDPKKIEPYWQAEWDRADLYLTREDRERPKFYVLEMFPYPSGDGLSVGHLHNYVPCDVIGRYKRMAGYNVLHAMGWDAFGLPAENDALLKGLHPKETVPRYAANFKRQLKLVGCAYDWTREINSSTPEYYRWTQWFFLLMLQARARLPRDRLAMVVRAVPHHPGQRAGGQRMLLAAHRHARSRKKDLEQWFFKITDYADRLLDDLDRHRLARADQADAAQLDRTLRGRGTGLPGRRPSGQGSPLLHHPARHGLRRLVHGARAGASAGRRDHHRPAARRGRGIRRRRRGARAKSNGSRRSRKRPASSPAHTRATCSTASSSRSGSPTTS